MKKHLALFSLVTAALIAAPSALRAEDTAAAPATTETTPAKKKNADAIPYHGAITAIDTTGSTITVGENKITITPTTKISRDGNKAKLTDFAVGDKVTGSYKKSATGDLNALSLREGKKAAGGKKKKAANE